MLLEYTTGRNVYKALLMSVIMSKHVTLMLPTVQKKKKEKRKTALSLWLSIYSNRAMSQGVCLLQKTNLSRDFTSPKFMLAMVRVKPTFLSSQLWVGIGSSSSSHAAITLKQWPLVSSREDGVS